MNKQELEKYIISKPNVTKRSIPGWKYIRYTVYDLAFATLEVKNIGVILTVWGRYEYYEKEYPDLIVPAVNNEPLHFTSILLTKGEVPDHVIKSLIDSSYKSRLRSVVMPRFCGIGRADIPYRLITGYNDNSLLENSRIETSAELSEIEASTEFEDFQRIKKEMANQPTDVELIGVGDCVNLPYAFGEDGNHYSTYSKLAKLKKDLVLLNKKYRIKRSKRDKK